MLKEIKTSGHDFCFQFHLVIKVLADGEGWGDEWLTKINFSDAGLISDVFTVS